MKTDNIACECNALTSNNRIQILIQILSYIYVHLLTALCEFGHTGAWYCENKKQKLKLLQIPVMVKLMQLHVKLCILKPSTTLLI